MSDNLLTISPSELKFRFELRKQVPTSLRLYNPTSEHVAFKVKTTAPKRYVVRPNIGAVAPNETREVIVIMQQQKEVPSDINGCKDKFLVQSTTIESVGKDDLSPTDIQSLFAKDRTKSSKFCENKLRVAYVQPIPPPSPVPENQEAEAAAAAESALTAAAALGSAAAAKGFLESNTTAKAVEASTTAAHQGDLQAKYTSVLSSLALATSERNSAVSDLEKAEKDSAELQNKIDALTGQLAAAKSAPATSTTVATKKAAVGFTLIHLLLTAILAFIIGRYT